MSETIFPESWIEAARNPRGENLALRRKHFTTAPEDVFCSDPSEYRNTTALALAEQSVAAYLENDQYAQAVMLAGYHGGKVIEEGDTQVALSWHPRAIVIAARGSSEAGDWLDDFSSAFRVGWSPPLPKRWFFSGETGRQQKGRPRIGAGFRRQAMDISPELLALVREARELYPRAPIAVTGHSLGAALVPLIVADLDYAGITAAVAYAFESPRVGNAAFAGWYHRIFDAGMPGLIYPTVTGPAGLRSYTPTYSVVNVVKGEPDVVTRFPRRYWGFRHVGRRVIHAGGQVLFGDDAWQSYRAANPVARWRLITRGVRSIRAHLGEQLLATLRAIVPTSDQL